jgi:NitT/TauT family transport system permease protein
LTRFLSLAVLIVLWTVLAAAIHSPLLPGPAAVAEAVLRDSRSLELPYHLACTLLRVVAAFAIAFSLGMAAGFAMGKSSLVDRIGDPWLVILLNLPALVTIILAYIWIGLNETAAIAAVALNKFPNVVVLTREGTRALSPELEDVAHVFCLSWPARIRHIVLPQLAPYLAAAFRPS